MDKFPQISEAQLIEFAKGIELMATKVLEGAHFSKRGGEGLEFHSSRPYADGEDVRFIDWKRFAATDRYFIKNFERQEKTGWSIFLDRSGSMAYGQKNEWAQNFIGCIIFLARSLGDSWSLYPLEEMDVSVALKNLLSRQAGVNFEKTELPDVPKGNRILVVSDFFFDSKVLKDRLAEWEAQGHSIYLIQCLDSQEAHFSFSDAIEFHDLESADRLLLDSRTVQKPYLYALSALNREWDQLLGSHSFRIQMTATIKDLEKQLLEFFERL